MNTKKIIEFLSQKEVKLFISFLIIYVYFVNWYGWNEESHFALTRAIVEENRFEINSFYNLTGDRSTYEGHYYSDKSPGLSFLASPVYMVWKLVYYNLFPKSFIKIHTTGKEYITTFHGRIPIYTYINPGFFILNSMFLVTVFTSSVFSALTVLLVYKISTKIVRGERRRIVITIAYALGTLAFPYALHFMSHAIATFFAFFAFYLLFNTKIMKIKRSQKNFLLAGLTVGFAVVVENFLIITIPLFLFYVFLLSTGKYHKNFSIFFSALIVGILPLIIYNYTIFGSPLEFASAYIDRKIYRSAYHRTAFNFLSLKNIGSCSPSNQFVKYSFFSSLEQVFKYFHLIPNPNPYVIVRLLIGPYRGLIFYSPILLLTFLGFYQILKKHKQYKLEVVFIVTIFLSLLIFISMRSNWWGGYCFGNRYLTLIVPFLFVPILFVANKFNFKFIVLLVVLSIFINILGLQPPEDYAYDWNLMDMRSDWSEKQNSFQIFYNPLVEHYLPNFLDKGPRSPLFENVVNGYFSIDIRMPALSKGKYFPFSAFHMPFLCLLPLLTIIILFWVKEIKTSLEKTFNM